VTPTSETTDLEVRPATAEDLPAVAELYLRARHAAYPAMPRGVHPDDEVRAWVHGWDLHRKEAWLANGPDGAPLGYAVLENDWLHSLYVAPDAQREGVGATLLDLAKARRPDGFCLWVFESNTPARGFYAAHGLVELEHTDGAGNEEHEPDLRMAWPGHDPIAFFRRLIDDVDDHLGDLLARRVALTSVVQQHKASELGDAARDADRERQIAERMAQRAPALGAERLQRIVHTIITESLDSASGLG
jgi:chorismate mutase/ribosomal protein S18 acetylase RimI-like enzyme